MTLRIEGTLTKWNDEKCYGFITPTQGGPEVFVHISAFPKFNGRPMIGEKVIFAVEVDNQGKKKARQITLPNRTSPNAPKLNTNKRRGKTNSISLSYVAKVVLVLAISIYLYNQLKPNNLNPETFVSSGKSDLTNSNTFKCDGRTHCSQMTSCAEAKYFLNNCPNTQMDGNNDGEPCEQQWCTSPFANQ